MDDEPPPPRKGTDEGMVLSILVAIGLVVVAFIYLPSVFFGGFARAHTRSPHNVMMQTSRMIGQMMFAYAVDHDNVYPTGKSSTEVFQKLIDESYCTDPAVFYFKMPGKRKAASTMPIKLKPENVCWDLTAGVKGDDPDELPLVFSTGYRIDYVPEGKATPIKASGITDSGMAVFYKGNNAMFIRDDGLSDHIVLNFIRPTFAPKGKTYEQLTPDGSLVPY